MTCKGKGEAVRVRIRTACTLLMALGLLASVGVASASAHEFIASKAGKIKGTPQYTWVFVTNAGAQECSTATPSGEVAKGKLKTIKLKVKYSGATSFGFFDTASEAE